MTPAQRGARLLRALGAEPALIRTLVAEVWRWPPTGALDVDDLWAIAVRTAWYVRQQQPGATVGFVRTRVKWELSKAVDRERLAKGWWRPQGQPWHRPLSRMARPEWDWGGICHATRRLSSAARRALGRRGGQARAAKLTAAERSAACQKAGVAGAKASAAQRTPAERSALARKAALAGVAKRRAVAA